MTISRWPFVPTNLLKIGLTLMLKLKPLGNFVHTLPPDQHEFDKNSTIIQTGGSYIMIPSYLAMNRSFVLDENRSTRVL